MRTKKAIINIIANVLVQITSIIIGLLVPKLLIVNYGSSINGLIQMITQIVSYFGIIEGGVATAAGAALYKPLVEKDYERINQIMTAVKGFYIKTGIFFLIIGIILCIIYPFTIQREVNIVTSATIIFLLTIISISGYLIFNKYNMILVSDQNHYITLISSAIVNILVAILQIILIYIKANIILVVLMTPILGLIRLIMLKKYVRYKYPYITYKSNKPDNKAINKKWEALSLNVSQMCKIVIPLITLSFMFDLKTVSVYSVYSMVFRVGSSLIETIGNSLTASFGNLIATDNEENLKRVYDISETLILIFISIISLGFFILINSFIKIYIGTETDINYNSPILAISFIINEAILNIRFSPKLILKAKGILKEVSKVSILEIILCTILTPIFCYIYGCEAVLFGSIITGLIQSVFMIVFVNIKILDIDIKIILKKIIINLTGIFISYYLIKLLFDMNPTGYISFIIDIIVTGLITGLILLVFNYKFLNKHFMLLKEQFLNLVIKKGRKKENECI